MADGGGKKRQLNYELLRTVAMLMIVCLHYLGKGGLLVDPARADMTAAGYTAWLIEAFCLVAVNVYVLISGYFGADSGRDVLSMDASDVVRRPLRIWKQVIFYSLFFGVIALVTGIQRFDVYQCFTYLFPIVTEHYWFATAYVVLCILMPFLNAGVYHMGRGTLRVLLAALLLLFCVSKTVLPMQLPWDKYGYDAYWFVTLYLTGAYIRRYGVKFINNRVKAAFVYIGSVLVIFASFVILRLVYLRTGRFEDLINYGYTYNFLFCYTGAVGLFLAFQNRAGDGQGASKSERLRKPIELASSATFGVYLIHEHINVRDKWGMLVDAQAVLNGSVALFVIKMLGTVLLVYVVCTLTELCRQWAGAQIGKCFRGKRQGGKNGAE